MLSSFESQAAVPVRLIQSNPVAVVTCDDSWFSSRSAPE